MSQKRIIFLIFFLFNKYNVRFDRQPNMIILWSYSKKWYHEWVINAALGFSCRFQYVMLLLGHWYFLFVAQDVSVDVSFLLILLAALHRVLKCTGSLLMLFTYFPVFLISPSVRQLLCGWIQLWLLIHIIPNCNCRVGSVLVVWRRRRETVLQGIRRRKTAQGGVGGEGDCTNTRKHTQTRSASGQRLTPDQTLLISL